MSRSYKNTVNKMGGNTRNAPRLNITLRPPSTTRFARTEYVLRMDEKGRLTIPQVVRERLMLEPNQYLRIWTKDETGFFAEAITISDVQLFLKDYDITFSQMDYVWFFLKDYSPMVKDWHNEGIDWIDLPYTTLVGLLRKYAGIMQESEIIEKCKKADNWNITQLNDDRGI